MNIELKELQEEILSLQERNKELEDLVIKHTEITKKYEIYQNRYLNAQAMSKVGNWEYNIQTGELTTTYRVKDAHYIKEQAILVLR